MAATTMTLPPPATEVAPPEAVASSPGLRLVWCALGGDAAGVAAALAAGVDIDATDDEGSTALAAAAWAGHTDVVCLLLARGANVNVRNATHGWSALFAAGARGHADIVAALLAGGAAAGEVDLHGKRAAEYAAEYGHRACASQLAAAAALAPRPVQSPPPPPTGMRLSPSGGASSCGSHAWAVWRLTARRLLALAWRMVVMCVSSAAGRCAALLHAKPLPLPAGTGVPPPPLRAGAAPPADVFGTGTPLARGADADADADASASRPPRALRHPL